MDIQNHFYGHTAVLAHAAGQPRVRHLAGLVQHGWVVTSPLVSNMGQFPSVGLPGALEFAGGRRCAWLSPPSTPGG